eukprot:gene11809-24740_t
MAGGFAHAPLTKSLCIIAVITTILLGNSPSKRGVLSLDLRRIYQGELWRAFTCSFAFSSLPQLIIGLMLMYTFRQFERQFGSKKFGSLVFLSYCISTLLQIAFVVLASSSGYSIVPTSGPFFFIYCMIPLFYQYIPKLHPLKISVLGASFSEKSWTYLLAIQLALSDGVPSVTACAAGFLAGFLYTIDGLGLQEFRIPRLIERPFVVTYNFLEGFFHLPGINNDTTQQRQRQRGLARVNLGNFGIGGVAPRFVAGGPGAGGGVGGGGAVPMPPAPPPAEESVSALTSLGFDRVAALRALSMSGNNVEMAANMLLSGG